MPWLMLSKDIWRQLNDFMKHMTRLLEDLQKEYFSHTLEWSKPAYRPINFFPYYKLIVDGITTDIVYFPDLMDGIVERAKSDTVYKEKYDKYVELICGYENIERINFYRELVYPVSSGSINVV